MYSMFYSFLDMICFTFPEFIFITSMVYIFLKRYDLIDFYRPLLTVKNICIPALCSAFVLNISEILAIKLIGQKG